jgi:hypothetical protein
MRVLSWLRDVFIRGWWQRIWFLITAPLSVLTSVVGPHNHPVLRWLPLGALSLGFVLSNIDVYSALKSQSEEAERRLHDLIATVKGALAGEHFTIKLDGSQPDRHTLVIEMILALKNPDGQHERSIEVRECVCNLPNLTKESVQFMGDPNSILYSPPGPYRSIGAGSSVDVIVKAVFDVLVSDKIASDEVSGFLSIVDNRGLKIDLPFDTLIISNAPVHF